MRRSVLGVCYLGVDVSGASSVGVVSALDSPACPIDRVREHDIARMSYDPRSRICIAIHYTPVEVKIGTRRSAIQRIQPHLEVCGTRPHDKSNTLLPVTGFFSSFSFFYSSASNLHVASVRIRGQLVAFVCPSRTRGSRTLRAFQGED